MKKNFKNPSSKLNTSENKTSLFWAPKIARAIADSIGADSFEFIRNKKSLLAIQFNFIPPDPKKEKKTTITNKRTKKSAACVKLLTLLCKGTKKKYPLSHKSKTNQISINCSDLLIGKVSEKLKFASDLLEWKAKKIGIDFTETTESFIFSKKLAITRDEKEDLFGLLNSIQYAEDLFFENPTINHSYAHKVGNKYVVQIKMGAAEKINGELNSNTVTTRNKKTDGAKNLLPTLSITNINKKVKPEVEVATPLDSFESKIKETIGIKAKDIVVEKTGISFYLNKKKYYALTEYFIKEIGYLKAEHLNKASNTIDNYEYFLGTGKSRIFVSFKDLFNKIPNLIQKKNSVSDQKAITID